MLCNFHAEKQKDHISFLPKEVLVVVGIAGGSRAGDNLRQVRVLARRQHSPNEGNLQQLENITTTTCLETIDGHEILNTTQTP